MTSDTGFAALLALRSPEKGRFKLREICEFLATKLEIKVSISQLSKIEHGEEYAKICPPLIALGLIAMYNARIATLANRLPMPIGNVHICCDRELKKDARCIRCHGRRQRQVVDVRALVRAAKA